MIFFSTNMPGTQELQNRHLQSLTCILLNPYTISINSPKNPTLSQRANFIASIFAYVSLWDIYPEPQYISLNCSPSITYILISSQDIPRHLPLKSLNFTFTTNYVGSFLLSDALQGKEGWRLTFCDAYSSLYPCILVIYWLSWLPSISWNPVTC